MAQKNKTGDQAFRLENPKEHWHEMTYGGALSFLRRKYTKDIKDTKSADIVVSGIPFDCATTHRPGCRLAPQAIRAASVQLAELNAFPYGFDPLKELSIIDYGDCYLDPHQPQTIALAIEQHADCILESGAKMLSFGGDHFISYPLLKAHAKKYGKIALLQFDAHADTWDDQPKRLDHGTMIKRAIDENIIDVDHSIQVGIRTWNDSDYGIEILSAPWVHRNGMEKTINKIKKRIKNKPLYLSFDIDGLDPAFAPGTGTPVSGGLASWQAIELIQALHQFNLVGMDLVEVSPPFDTSEITALAAATMAYQWLCQIALQKGAKVQNTGLV